MSKEIDCVDRQDVERYIEGFINEYISKDELDLINIELDGLKHLPSVIPQELKRGHWLVAKDEKSAVCSYCNRNNVLFGDYCKFCGAKMDSEVIEWSIT